MSQIVQVVSMLDVPKRLGSVSFQSKDVSGAQNSLFLFWHAPKEPSHCARLQSRGSQVLPRALQRRSTHTPFLLGSVSQNLRSSC